MFGWGFNMHTQKKKKKKKKRVRGWGLFLLLAKYHIFHAKTNNNSPLIQVFVTTVTDLPAKTTTH